MGKYTEDLEELSFELDPCDEGYEERLVEAARGFRPFDEALVAFLVEKDFLQEGVTPDDTLSFITDAFKNAGIEPPRNRKKWFTEHKSINRKTAFEVCFALGLDEERSEDFFRRVCLERAFDGHDMTEIVYRYAIRTGLSYKQAIDIIEKITIVKPDKKLSEGQVVYTDMIRSEVDEIDSEDELIEYLTENSANFEYNHATAIGYIRTMWDEIAGDGGLAVREREKYEPSYQEDTENYGRVDGRVQITASREDSLWDIYLQILGLNHIDMKKLGTDRSLKPILKNRELMHPLAEDSFPDRDGLNKVLNGEHVSHERVRKLLILLEFYRFWARLLLENGDYAVKGGDLSRCEQSINNYLLDSGYQSLYIGNPYDWMILYSLANSENPLMDFRSFINDLYYSR